MKYLSIIIFLSIIYPRMSSAESIAVVANTEEISIELSVQEIRNLFMGNILSYDLRAVSLSPGNLTRVLFNTKVVGITESRIQSYWAQMRFSGRKRQPIELSNEVLVLEYLLSNPGTISYLPADMEIPVGLTVILLVE